MKERPILFSAPMVRAILAGDKTQTRRIVKLPENAKHVQYWTPPSGKSEPGWADPGVNYWTPDPSGETDSNHLDRCPYGQPGDRLWVREAWQAACGDKRAARIVESPRPDFGWIEYAATCDDPPPRWRPSIHMPRWASRILLEIVAVRVERLQDISEADAEAEGCPNSLHLQAGRFANENFAHLWWQINGDGSWEANPWVWVLKFKRVTP